MEFILISEITFKVSCGSHFYTLHFKRESDKIFSVTVNNSIEFVYNSNTYPSLEDLYEYIQLYRRFKNT